MTDARSATSAWTGPAILAFGFRPFFLIGGLWAACSMALWLVMLRAGPLLPSSLDPFSWHAHEALFGYLGAVIAGFLLTAVPSWTGRPPLAGWPLLGLVALWVLGRVAIAVSSHLSALVVIVADLAFLGALGALLLREIVVARNWRNLVVIGMVGVFLAGNALFHAEAVAGSHPASGYGLRIALAAAIMMISVIGGRIVPAFTRNWLAARGSEALPAAFGRADRVALAASVLALASWVASPDGLGAGVLLLVAGVAQCVRLARWRWRGTLAEPLVWILHVGFAFVPLGMVAMGAAALRPGALVTAAAQHLWMAGAIGVMTLAVMTRATLGHSGRALTAGAGTTGLYLLVIASVLARLAAGAFPDSMLPLLTVSAALWILGFAGFALLYAPLLIGPAAR